MANIITSQSSTLVLLTLVLSGLLILLASCVTNPQLQEKIINTPTQIVVPTAIAQPTKILPMPPPVVSTIIYTPTVLPPTPTLVTITMSATHTSVADTVTPTAVRPTDIAEITPIPGPMASLTPIPTDTILPTATTWPSPIFTPTITPPPPAPKRPPIQAVPGNPTSYLDNYQLITYYGSPWGRGLGILGNYPYDEMLSRLRGVVAQYQPLDYRFAMPTFHMITTVANSNPPEYRHLVDMPTIENWIQSAKWAEGAAIIDIQPGRVNVLDEVGRIRHLLYNTHVHLAIDPEFVMNNEQVPGVQVGQLDANTINQVQAQLNQIANEIGVKRVLILHQFKDSMLPDKHLIQDYPGVEVVIDSDGTFNTNVKVYNYNLYAGEGGFEYGGIKIFYNYDDYILSAEDVMNLRPIPAVIIYQ